MIIKLQDQSSDAVTYHVNEILRLTGYRWDLTQKMKTIRKLVWFHYYGSEGHDRVKEYCERNALETSDNTTSLSIWLSLKYDFAQL